MAHATRHNENLGLARGQPNMATLMGAQLLVATGKKHAGVLTHREELEVK